MRTNHTQVVSGKANKFAAFINMVRSDLKARASKKDKAIEIVLTLLHLVLVDAANAEREFEGLNAAERARLAMQATEKAMDMLSQRLGFTVDDIFSKALGLVPADSPDKSRQFSAA